MNDPVKICSSIKFGYGRYTPPKESLRPAGLPGAAHESVPLTEN
jgi:hypothetical protein